MIRITTLLIVMAIAGTPVGSAACELWCNSPAGGDHHRAVGCHDASQSGPQGPRIAPYVIDCDPAIAIAPFVNEARQTESRMLAAARLAFFQPGTIGSDYDDVPTGWCVFNVQPPRPYSSRDVLRV